MTKARKLLLRGLSSDGSEDVWVKLLSESVRGRIYEYTDGKTGETLAFRFHYPDGRVEMKHVKKTGKGE